jgi:hypothetical protein
MCSLPYDNHRAAGGGSAHRNVGVVERRRYGEHGVRDEMRHAAPRRERVAEAGRAGAGLPESLTMILQGPADSTRGATSQLARFHIVPDSAILEVTKNTSLQRQAYPTRQPPFPMLTGDVALVDQLLRHALAQRRDSVGVLVLGVSRSVSMATVTRLGGDSVSMRLLGATLVAHWTTAEGLIAGAYGGSTFRIAQLRGAGQRAGEGTCALPAVWLTPAPVGQRS